MAGPTAVVPSWGSRHALRVFALAGVAAALLLAIASAPAHAAREYECEITGLEAAPPDECNGTGNATPNQSLQPRGVTVDSSGNIWVADATARVFKFDPSGNYLAQNDGSTTWGPEGLTDLAFSSSANQIYGTQPTTGDAWKISPDATSPGRLVTGSGYVSGFADAAVDNSGGSHGGDLYIGYQGSYVARYKPDGSPDPFDAEAKYLAENRIVGSPSNPQSLVTLDIATGSDGDLYDLIYNNSSGQIELLRYDPSGAFVRNYPGSFSAASSKVAIDPTSGNILIYDSYGTSEIQTIWEYDSGGTELRQITGASSKSPFESIGGVGEMTVGPDGRIYLSEEGAIHVLGAAEPLPRITYGPETGLTRSEIDLHATVDPNGAGDITSCVIEYGKTRSYESTPLPCNPAPAPKYSAPTPIDAHLSGLEGERTYHYRVVVETAAGQRRGDDRTFKLTAVDDVTTGGATEVGTTSAKLAGTFSDDGTPAKFFFEFGNTVELGQKSPLPPGADAPGGGGTVGVSSTVENLLPGKVYFYRLAVTYGNGVSHGLTKTFETLQGPTIESFAASEVNETSANLVGRINPNGFATTYRFEYGPTPAYGQTAPVPEGQLAASTTVQPITTHLEGLIPETTYHFRLIAESEQGTVTTEDQTFTFFPPNCPNAQVRLETTSSYLPDCRAYELVSPPDAGGILLATDAPPSASATDPARFGYSGIFGTLRGVGLPPNVRGDLYIAERSPTGWATKYVGIPSDKGLENGGSPAEFIGRPSGVLTDPSLSEYMVWNTGNQGYVCPCDDGSMAPYIFDAHGNQIERLPSNLNEITGGEDFAGEVQPSGDFRHVFFSSLGPAFATGGLTSAPGSAYDDNRASGVVELISTAPGGTGPILQDPEGPKDPGEFIHFPAVSADGSHVLMSTSAANGRHLYMHAGGKTVDVSLGQDGKNHGVEFNGMTDDGSEVLFSSNEQLTADDHDTSKDIFAWHEAGNTVTRISTGINGAGDTDECTSEWTSKCDATVVPQGTTNGLFGPVPSTDTAYGKANGEIYFYSPEQLDGVRGLTGQRNLYTFHEGRVEHVATLRSDSQLQRIQVSPDNEHAAFLTASPLTAFDNHGFTEMYGYDTNQRKLICVSCPPSGDPPTTNVAASFNGLFMADDGRTFFTTSDSLVDADINGLRDTYEYVDGRPQLITSGLANRDTGLLGFFVAGLVGVSHDGTNVYFASYEKLVDQDNNGQFMRFYDARTGGGFPNPPPPAPCAAADECHGADSSAPVPPEITSGARLGKGGNAVNEKQHKHGAKKKCSKNKKAKCKKGSKKTKKSAGGRGAGR